MVISRIIKSGLNSRALSIASWPFEVSPQTSMSPRDSRMTHTPLRTASWSSATRMRTLLAFPKCVAPKRYYSKSSDGSEVVSDVGVAEAGSRLAEDCSAFSIAAIKEERSFDATQCTPAAFAILSSSGRS
jgi:hypothetical protein